MAGIFDSLNFDPLALLQARALDPSTTGSVAAPGGAVSPAPPAATPPAPVASPAATGGGGSFLGGIGTAMANILQGSGASGDIPSDTEIDPVSGIPKGIARRANNQSMMKMGMTLLMAGLSRDPGTRGKMLAALPGTMDATDTINNFAKTRLEMARTKLIERQILAEEATTARAQATYGPQGGPVGTVAPGTPVTNPAGSPPVGAGPVGRYSTPRSRWRHSWRNCGRSCHYWRGCPGSRRRCPRRCGRGRADPAHPRGRGRAPDEAPARPLRCPSGHQRLRNALR
jgi:hypothetical protein